MFSDLLIKLRKEKGMTQKDLAEVLHISDKSISRWENGSNLPSLEMMYEISKVFGVPFNTLIKARVSNDNVDDTYKEIINELSVINKKKIKVFKIIILISLITILILGVAIIFTNSYNRFKVYDVNVENDEFIKTTGFYVETKRRDILNFGNIKIKGVEVSDKDIVSVDLYILIDGEKKILNNYTSLDNISFVNYQENTKIEDLTKYIDNIYLSVSIINEKGKSKEFETRLKFLLNFTNNKILYKDDLDETINKAKHKFSKDDIRNILLKNNFESLNNNNTFMKNDGKYKITYFSNYSRVSISYVKDKLNYSYNYNLESGLLEVRVYNNDSTDIQKYTYDTINEKIVICKTGSCNNYEYAMKIINDNFLNLLER